MVRKYSSKAFRAKKEVNPHSSIHTFLIMAMNKSPFHSTLQFFFLISLLTRLQKWMSRFTLNFIREHRSWKIALLILHPRSSERAIRDEMFADFNKRETESERGKDRHFSISVSDACPGLGGKSNIGIALAGKVALVFRLRAQS